jgi:conjugative transfer pilus assembly protein TraH
MDAGIDAFLRDWEAQMSSSPAGFFEGQSRGFVSGGSFQMRFPNRNPTPFTISMPSLSAGCGGISLMGGGFSFINMEAFTQYLQSIAQNAMGMAFNMALTTLCPQCATVLSKLEQVARDVAGNLKSSCQMTRNLFQAAGLTPDKFAQTAFENCKQINESLGAVSDWWGGDSVCRDPSAAQQADQREEQRWRAAGSNPFDPPKSTSLNIFWSGYSRIQGNLPEYTQAFGEQLMSLFGTVVTNLDTGGPTPYVSTLSILDLIDGYDAKQSYACDTGDLCLNPQTTLPPAYVGLATTIRSQLVTYKAALANRQRTALSQYLTSDVMGIPLVRLMVTSTNVPGASDMIINLVSRYVATQLLRVYTRQIGDAIFAETQRVKHSGELETFNKMFEMNRKAMDQEFDLAEGQLLKGLRVMQELTTLTNANAGSSSSMFARHASFSGQLLRNASPMGH